MSGKKRNPSKKTIPACTRRRTAGILILIMLAFAPSPMSMGTEEGAVWRSLTGAKNLDAFSVTTEPLPDGLRLTCTLNGWWEQPIQQEGSTFLRITVPELGLCGNIGAPELPVWRRLIEVPRGTKEVACSIVKDDMKCLAKADGIINPIYPVQPPRPKTVYGSKAIPFAWDKEAYEQSLRARSVPAECERLGTIRARDYFMLTVYPLDYIPDAGELSAHYTLSVELQWPSNKALSTAPSRYTAPIYENVVALLSANAPVAKSISKAVIPQGYLIVVPPAYASVPALNDYVLWKMKKGFQTSIITTDETGSTPAQIKSFLQDAYNTWDIPPAYILLAGDTDTIPAWTGSQEDNPATDLYYAALDGDEWNTPDVLVGRIPAASADNLDTILSKIIAYEHEGEPEMPNGWEQRAAFMAGSDQYTVSEGTHNNVITTYLDPAGYTSNRLYYTSYGARTASISSAIQAGQTLAVYSGHGSVSAWTDGPAFNQTHVNALNNEAYPVVLSFSCLTGAFSEPECFGETWIRSSHGAVSYLGSSVTSYWDEDDILERGIFAGLFTKDITVSAAMIQYGLQWLRVYYGNTATIHRYFEQYNLLGDPSLDVVTAPRDNPAIVHPTIIPSGSMDLTVSGASDGAIVTAIHDGKILGMSESLNGLANVYFNAPIQTGSITLTVTGHNQLPYEAEISIASTSDGVILFDKTVYTCPSTIQVTVFDSDLEFEMPIVTVHASNDSETLNLISSGTPGCFLGTLLGVCTDEIPSNGTLSLKQGDSLSAEYLDISDGAGQVCIKTATATVDTEGPLIASVQVSEIAHEHATVILTAEEPVTAHIRYWIAGQENTSITIENDRLASLHTFHLSSLLPATTYEYTLDVWDEPGNNTQDETPRAFTTPSRTDYFTQVFDAVDHDIAYHSLLLIPCESSNGYQACVADRSTFPVSPESGEVIILSDDSYKEKTLTNGKLIKFYDNQYNKVYISSNGYLTFSKGDTTYKYSLADHFSLPRISGFFADLTPNRGGVVYWAELNDCVVTTYLSVPVYASSETVSFQIECFWDGRLRITWLALGATENLTGISKGNGIPEDFTESYLMGYGDCKNGAENEYHSADINHDFQISAIEINRVVTLYNSKEYCILDGTEDGYAPGSGSHLGNTHHSDFSPTDWSISTIELNRLVTLYNSNGYSYKPGTMDGFTPFILLPTQ